MAEPIELSQLADALELGDHELISLVGGGGKSTSMFALGEQLSGTRVLTTTTKMGRNQTGGLSVMFAPSDPELAAALAEHRSVVAWQADGGYKAIGVAPETCDCWFDIADHVVIEADGARRHPFTAPRPREPVIPNRTTTMVACIGADALDRVIADQCHTPLRVAAVARCSPYQRLTPERAARVLLDERGSRKSCPAAARFAVLVTKVDATTRALTDELEEAIGDAAPVVRVSFDPALHSG